ncbi:hypothetical protein OGAPHI_004397 [Ogataea philodendri]|uniref:Myb-like domain-containing protein n=1 Tax=Ogataea philodendri TaxID=1378263 RepID=A0A9P8P639_9ASCO|nr:uncharacterized protein OGAPHI_004397 [Ogataea philodendri]KAH3666208.1 hypothetical protein OGAPHI_004397 [Ogataea philodendri]
MDNNKNNNRITLPSIRDLQTDLSPSSSPPTQPLQLALPRISTAHARSPSQSSISTPSQYMLSPQLPPPRQYTYSQQHPYSMPHPYMGAYRHDPFDHVDYLAHSPTYPLPPPSASAPYPVSQPPMIIPTPPQSSTRYDSKSSTAWTPEDDKLLRMLKEEKNYGWREIASYFPNRTLNACQFRWRRLVVGVAGKRGSEGSVSPKRTRSRVHSQDGEDSESEKSKDKISDKEKEKEGKLVLLLDSVGGGRTLSSIDQLFSKTFGNGLDVSESSLSSTNSEQSNSLVDSSEWRHIDGLSSNGTGRSNSCGVFSWTGVDNSVNNNLEWVLVGQDVDDLHGVLDDSNSLELLTVVSTVHHQGVGQSLDNRTLSLSESLGSVSSGSVGDVDWLSDLDVVSQRDVLDGDIFKRPFVEQLDLLGANLDIFWDRSGKLDELHLNWFRDDLFFVSFNWLCFNFRHG